MIVWQSLQRFLQASDRLALGGDLVGRLTARLRLFAEDLERFAAATAATVVIARDVRRDAEQPSERLGVGAKSSRRAPRRGEGVLQQIFGVVLVEPTDATQEAVHSNVVAIEQRPEGRAIMTRYGFVLPGETRDN